MLDLFGGTVAGLALMGAAAMVIGYSKTALGGLAVVSVAIFATVLPAKQSTAAILAVLIVGDLVAVWHYRHDADWALIRRLLPAVVPGLAVGSLFLGLVGDETLRRSIGGVLLVLLLLQLWVRWRAAGVANDNHQHPAAAWGAGTAAGFATMTANAAGPVMTLYLSASGIDKRRFVGTNAWFFLVVNLVKVPFSVGLGLLHLDDAARAGLLAPLVLLGGLLGYATVRRISQRGFDVAVLAASAVAAAALLLG
ncbi:sulfite exporter TauE/SafE family protein [uncultured Phycicoccus sp.]|uniref:sulfite exporter TauE/SafE family protein n=1 Tax=uncultured Phycicoccus sp. TaxID=661422 RepID=UPI002605EF22|nr:sulfite exporter TauE/SafE family protein [uncultured Phycicoccus sp.]